MLYIYVFLFRFKPGDNSYSWLQRQQDKLKARREGRGWEDKYQKEQLLLEELRRTQKKTLPNGESMDDVSLGLDFSSSSRETSPPKVMRNKVIFSNST